MIRNLVICLVILATVSSFSTALNAELEEEWVKFVKTHSKVYKNKIEELHRRSIFEENLKKINEHNKDPKATFSMKMNRFGDLTNKEFGQKFLSRPNANNANNMKPELSLKDIPDSVDWRTKGCVGPIVNQGQCGSSWAFGVVASLEGTICANGGKFASLSVQQLIDCSTSFGNAGCNGGFLDQSFAYIKQYGLESNESYPYASVEQTCQYDKSKVIAYCKGSVSVKAGDEDEFTAAIASGPVSNAVEASQTSFQFYSGGIYYEPKCQNYIDHGVATVGYGSQGKDLDFYIVKNSWGTDWGDKGYIYMSRNRNNNCGIASAAVYPLV